MIWAPGTEPWRKCGLKVNEELDLDPAKRHILEATTKKYFVQYRLVCSLVIWQCLASCDFHTIPAERRQKQLRHLLHGAWHSRPSSCSGLHGLSDGAIDDLVCRLLARGLNQL